MAESRVSFGGATHQWVLHTRESEVADLIMEPVLSALERVREADRDLGESLPQVPLAGGRAFP